MDILGTRLGVLCLTVAVLLSGCAASGAEQPDRRTPPARDAPSGELGDLADRGASGIAGY
ncbi:hypothetical protein [Nocardioides daeguensis]|uniref:Uncharacterized protein n=1 Tax=Nocardioides daeguensis TaxID=908359 RepID=A0ABP6UWL9_9ACTN|nr:hypothetical protein [Nocardioides daeguensis]MBV6725659.1 hypothetical protein [Nocardioides daeguensis]MCR1772826.1 hypothetical protein [Nocardioides daeguensis]